LGGRENGDDVVVLKILGFYPVPRDQGCGIMHSEALLEGVDGGVLFWSGVRIGRNVQ